MAISEDVSGTLNGISKTIFSFADRLVDVTAEAFRPQLNAQGDVIFGPESTPLPASQGAILAQQAQSDRFNTVLIIGAVGLGLILLFSR